MAVEVGGATAYGPGAMKLFWSLAAAVLVLAVAVPAFAAFRYLRSEVETFDGEMRAASLDLANALSLRLGRAGG